MTTALAQSINIETVSNQTFCTCAGCAKHGTCARHLGFVQKLGFHPIYGRFGGENHDQLLQLI